MTIEPYTTYVVPNTCPTKSGNKPTCKPKTAVKVVALDRGANYSNTGVYGYYTIPLGRYNTSLRL